MVKSGWFAETFALEEPLPTLAQYYRGALRLAAEPGTTWTYTDHGFGVLGQIVEDLSGQPLHRYLREHIFDPLGMPSCDLLRSEAVRARLATGYTLGRKGATAVTDRHGVAGGRRGLLLAPRHGALPRRASRRRLRGARLDPQTRHGRDDVRPALPAGPADRRHGPGVLEG